MVSRAAAAGAAAHAGADARGDPARDLRQPRPRAARRAARGARHDGIDAEPDRDVARAARPRRRAPFGRFLRAVERIDELLYERIDAPATATRSSTCSRRSGATREELRDQLVTLLAAGHETTATALAWALERLARHPTRSTRRRAHRRRSSKRSCAPAPCSRSPPARRSSPTNSAAHAPGGRLRRPLPVPRPPPRDGPTTLRPAAVPRRRARAVHLHPVRRRQPPLPRRRVRRAGDARGAASGRRAVHTQTDAAEGERMRRRSVTLAPARGADDHPRRASVRRRDVRHVLSS